MRRSLILALVFMFVLDVSLDYSLNTPECIVLGVLICYLLAGLVGNAVTCVSEECHDVLGNGVAYSNFHNPAPKSDHQVRESIILIIAPDIQDFNAKRRTVGKLRALEVYPSLVRFHINAYR